MSKSTDNPASILIVFAHRAVSTDRQPVNVFREATREGDRFTLGKERVWSRGGKGMSKTILATPVIGCVYEVGILALDNDSLTLYPGTAKFIGRHDDKRLLSRWAAQDAGAKGELDAIAGLKRAKKDDTFARALEPVRDAYRRATGRQRAQILARAVAIIIDDGA